MVSGSETAFFSLEPADVDEIKASSGKTRETIIHLISNPKTLLATILIANNFINVAIVIISSYITTFFISNTSNTVLVFLVQVVLITSVILIFGEIIPKILANRRAVQMVQFMATPMVYLEKVFKPLSYILVSSTSFIDRRIGKKGHEISLSELSTAIEMTIDEHSPEGEKMILKGLASFSDTEASEIMNSRLEIFALESDMPFVEMMPLAIESGYSRIPVYEDSIDKVLGVLYVKDLLPYINGEEKKDWLSLLRPVFYIPENKQINELLQDFRTKKIHLAIVVDEYGGTSGLISLEDIIEEIVGEISDEFDDEETDYRKINENKYRFMAKTTINDFCKILEIDDDIFNMVKGESDSLGGLILEINGDLPDAFSEIIYGKFKFTILDVDERKINEIEVNILDDEEEK